MPLIQAGFIYEAGTLLNCQTCARSGFTDATLFLINDLCYDGAMRIVPALLLLLAASCGSVEPPESARDVLGRSIPFETTSVVYDSLGSGSETVVLIHGWSGDRTLWREQIPHLSRRYQLIVIDLPGHGESGKPPIEYSQNLFARSVAAVLSDAGVDQPVVLVGHSMGTAVARQFYRLFPERTRGIIAIDGSLRRFGDIAQTESFIGPLRGEDYRTHMSRMVDGMTSRSPETLRDSIRASMLRTPQHVAVSAAEGMFADEIWSDDEIRVPLLSVLARSPYWDDEYENYVRSLAPLSRMVIIDDADHFLMLSRAAAVNETIDYFLASIDLF
jgi:non-heme chloroperoxidase